ncbi:MAG TPA: PQQ-dependent sugar dehydrogenase [Gammaproteobacteria bacterium]|nr:PQQ-dependent sugar dehydrogenase [Gammaproteobacteria bacterium]
MKRTVTVWRKWMTILLGVSAAMSAVAVENSQQGLPVNLPAQGLPPPFATPSVANPANIIPRPPGVELKLPPGFKVAEWATGLPGPRYMLLGPGGEVLVSAMHAGAIMVIRDGSTKTLIDDLTGPFGLAFHDRWLYVAETTSVKRYPYDSNAMTVGKGEEVISLEGTDSGHVTRTLLFDAKHEYLYVSVGSGSNVNAGEPAIRAAINRYRPDGSGHEIYASGIRNAMGLGWNPVTGELWATSHERDGLGDDLPPDFLTRVQQGGFYGWPYAYIGPHEDPRRKGEAPDLVAKTLYPSVLLGGHAGAMGLLFYTGSQFPEKYRNGCFVALHGSWNRAKHAGYRVVFVPFSHGKPVSGPEDFLTGWMLGEDRQEVWGRPVGLLQLPDGSLLVSDDGAGKIWRVSYAATK